eukprot:GFKZ01012850.1.p1 GENE.GFKZ01012850.1~~GFKZ01012850.1.p1  ORF type:complete len:369 (+),score=29.40 GFKZ01012850.1:92-1198(+)
MSRASMYVTKTPTSIKALRQAEPSAPTALRFPFRTCFLPYPTFHTTLCHHPRRRVQLCCSIESQDKPLSPEEISAIEAAALVTHYFSINNSSPLTTWQLAAFCNIKNLPLPSNLWDRSALESVARSYLRRERLSRVKRGAEWEAMSTPQKIRCLHEVCNAEGDVTYIDPATGYTVFSHYGHLKRGSCCGVKKGQGGDIERIHRCRHCPYDQEGMLRSAKLKGLQDRIQVVQRTKERAQELYKEGIDGVGLRIENGLDVREKEPMTSGAEIDTTNDGDKGESMVGVRERHGLAERFAKVVRREPESAKKEKVDCATCGDERYVTCTRCKGWTFLVSPQMMKCPQCDAKGYHPCMECTPFRPPLRSSFYS